MHQKPSLFKKFIPVLIFSFLASSHASAQNGTYIGGYKQVKRLGGTSQSICRPAIQSADELQSFALNQRQDVIDILESANWQGSADDVFAAIEAGNFVEKSFPVGTKLEWMGLREKGKPAAAEKRQWAGKQGFEGFELNLVSNCQQHQLVIPKACCNLSLVKSTPVNLRSPVVLVSANEQNAKIVVNSLGADQITTLTHPDGRKETLTLTDGMWSGALPAGDYIVESRTVSDCGESVIVSKPLTIAPTPVAVIPPVVKSGWFFAPVIGRQIRSVDPLILGLQAGKLTAINDKTNWLVQAGGSYNTDVDELSLFVDLGLERDIGATGFLGGGVGIWDINNGNENITNSTESKKDVSYFFQGGADTHWKYKNHPIQWFGEYRIFDDFLDDISHHNLVRIGLRMFH